MVSTYIQPSLSNDSHISMNINNIRKSNQDLTLQGQSELIYNLSDVGKFLPNINEYEKFEDACTEIFTRKRKERQDSENLSNHECKLIRSNSEERTVEDKIAADDNIRRVSSHEDFEKCKRIIKHSQVSPLQNNFGNNLPLRSHNLPSSNENIFLKDWGKAEIVGEKYSKMFSQDNDNENSFENYKSCYKYNKNDNSPLRSSIHEYILFPKRISPNRDPNVVGTNKICEGEYQDVERDAEKARSCERRSRARRIPQRRLQKNYSEQTKNLTRYGNHCVNSRSGQQTNKKNINNKLEEGCGNMSVIMGHSLDFQHGNNQMSNMSQDIVNTFNIQNKFKSRDRSPSPDTHSKSPIRKTAIIDLTTLHEHLGQQEPMPSVPIKYTKVSSDSNIYDQNECEPLLDCNIVGYSKEISEIQNQNRLYPEKIDYSGIQVLSGASVMEPDERLQKLSKKIQVLKKKISKFEVDFELNNGYRASHADKMNDSTFRKLYVELRKLKNERKNVKRGPSDFMFRQLHSTSEEQPLKNKPMGEIMTEIERRLEAKRWAHGRPSELESCSKAQLIDEKIAVQRALLWLEGARGRPTLQPDRDSARPLYDRYRTVKRLVAGFDAMKLNAVGELATILEHETLPTVESPIESPESGDKTSYSETDSPINSSDNNEADAGASSSTKSTASDKPILGDDIIQDSINENLHCLSLSELNKLLFEAKTTKTSLRNKIKDMEKFYDERNNRKALKEEKNPVMPIYAKYKETKARIRLLSALVNKQRKSYG